MLVFIGYILTGLTAGVLSGLIGIGGGIVMVPTLVMLFKMTQHQAQGTSLAVMVPPVGLLAAWQYYKTGFIDVKIAALICVGFVLGGFLGAKLATSISNNILEKCFGIVLITVGIKMLLK